MRIHVTSVFVDEQTKGLDFYTDVLGFEKRTDLPLGEDRWLTVGSPAQPDRPELLLEPPGHPAVGPFEEALVEDGIPSVSFGVDHVQAEFERLRAPGVRFTQEALEMGGSRWRSSTTPAATSSRSPRRSRRVRSSALHPGPDPADTDGGRTPRRAALRLAPVGMARCRCTR
jgi:catechol 2,3-dioxygenase-like lactoylglutathione lyase family enzyme